MSLTQDGKPLTTAFIGAGQMGGAMLRGLLTSGSLMPEHMSACDIVKSQYTEQDPRTDTTSTGPRFLIHCGWHCCVNAEALTLHSGTPTTVPYLIAVCSRKATRIRHHGERLEALGGSQRALIGCGNLVVARGDVIKATQQLPGADLAGPCRAVVVEVQRVSQRENVTSHAHEVSGRPVWLRSVRVAQPPIRFRAEINFQRGPLVG